MTYVTTFDYTNILRESTLKSSYVTPDSQDFIEVCLAAQVTYTFNNLKDVLTKLILGKKNQTLRLVQYVFIYLSSRS